MKNAVIEYLYRDAANYTKVNQCIISGVVTADMERIIWGCLDEDVYFIPSQASGRAKRHHRPQPRPLLVRVGRRLCPYQRGSDC